MPGSLALKKEQTVADLEEELRVRFAG